MKLQFSKRLGKLYGKTVNVCHNAKDASFGLDCVVRNTERAASATCAETKAILVDIKEGYQDARKSRNPQKPQNEISYPVL